MVPFPSRILISRQHCIILSKETLDSVPLRALEGHFLLVILKPGFETSCYRVNVPSHSLVRIIWINPVPANCKSATADIICPVVPRHYFHPTQEPQKFRETFLFLFNTSQVMPDSLPQSGTDKLDYGAVKLIPYSMP